MSHQYRPACSHSVLRDPNHPAVWLCLYLPLDFI
jgi:hypothetical protein